MKIEALTNNPQQLVNAINNALKDGDLKTWKKVENNKKETLYSHTRTMDRKSYAQTMYL